MLFRDEFEHLNSPSFRLRLSATTAAFLGGGASEELSESESSLLSAFLAAGLGAALAGGAGAFLGGGASEELSESSDEDSGFFTGTDFFLSSCAFACGDVRRRLQVRH